VDGADDFAAIDALQVDACDPEVRVSELPLDDDEWDALVCHLDRVCVSQLMRREATAHPSCQGSVMKLLPGG
jgi:hypothetical protein